MLRSATLVLLLGSPALAGATEIGAARPFGLGLTLGEPSGLTGKLYLGGRQNALDFALGSGAWDNEAGRVYAHVTYHWHPSVLLDDPDLEIVWRVGVGGFVADRGNPDNNDVDTAIGARVPLGVDIDLNQIPLQFFAEITANVPVVPWVDVGLGAAIGGRYYF